MVSYLTVAVTVSEVWMTLW